jgi:hypothetical protein
MLFSRVLAFFQNLAMKVVSTGSAVKDHAQQNLLVSYHVFGVIKKTDNEDVTDSKLF